MIKDARVLKHIRGYLFFLFWQGTISIPDFFCHRFTLFPFIFRAPTLDRSKF
jgi:hypothetical protein